MFRVLVISVCFNAGLSGAEIGISRISVAEISELRLFHLLARRNSLCYGTISVFNVFFTVNFLPCLLLGWCVLFSLRLRERTLITVLSDHWALHISSEINTSYTTVMVVTEGP